MTHPPAETRRPTLTAGRCVRAISWAAGIPTKPTEEAGLPRWKQPSALACLCSRARFSLDRSPLPHGDLLVRGFPSGSAVKSLPAVQETQEVWVRSLGQDDPLEEGMAAPPVFLPGESHGQRSLVGYGPQVPRVRHD